MAPQGEKKMTAARKAIHAAFVSMVCEGDLGAINVKSLTERAGIHRKTFYIHYPCIEALYEEEIQRLADEYMEEVAMLPVPLNYLDLTRVFFEFNTQSVYHEALFCTSTCSELRSRIFTITLPNNRSITNLFSGYSPEMQNIINSFIAHASAAACRQWIADGKQVPLDEVVDVVSTLLQDGVNAIKHVVHNTDM